MCQCGKRQCQGMDTGGIIYWGPLLYHSMTGSDLNNNSDHFTYLASPPQLPHHVPSKGLNASHMLFY